MRVDFPPEMLWLVVIMVGAMCFASIWSPGAVRKKQKEQQQRSDAILAASKEHQARNTALLDRQEALLSQAEQLLKRIDERLTH